jgi:hypothetical protein
MTLFFVVLGMSCRAHSDATRGHRVAGYVRQYSMLRTTLKLR